MAPAIARHHQDAKVSSVLNFLVFPLAYFEISLTQSMHLYRSTVTKIITLHLSTHP